jgi:hypothetical protein
MNTTDITLPSGEILKIKLPVSPNRNIQEHMLGLCKFHIPSSKIKEKLEAGKWPHPKVLKQAMGKNSVPEPELWSGTETMWKEHLRLAETDKINKRAHKIRAVRKAKAVLSKLTEDEWAALKTVFSIQPHFH